MPSLQTPSTAARDVAGVFSAIAAAKHSDAQTNARELIITFVNFVFIVIVSFCLSFSFSAFFNSPSLSYHFRPFTGVLRRICRFVTPEMRRDVETLNGLNR
jgi:hypothetical protein